MQRSQPTLPGLVSELGSLPPWAALALLLLAAGPAIAFAVGGVPHTARTGLAAGGLSSLATVAHQLVSGYRPYGPGFHGAVPFIYPPGIFAFIVPPLLAGPGRFVLGFSVLMLLLILGAVPLVLRASGHSGLGWAVIGALAAAGPLSLYRPDAAIGILLLAAALSASRRRPALAYLLVFAAGLIKEYALVDLVPLVAIQLGEGGPGQLLAARLGAVLRSLLVGALPALAVVAAVAAWSGGALLQSQLHNLDRGVEVESLPAAVALALVRLRGVVVARGTLGSMEISGPGLHLPAISTAVAILGLVALAVIAWRCLRGGSPPGLALAAALGIALLATPVLSPQYLDALTPCLCLAAWEVGGRARAALLMATVLVALLTQLEFPYLWTSVVTLSPAGVAALELRNLLLLTTVLGSGWLLLRRRPRPHVGGGQAPALAPATPSS